MYIAQLALFLYNIYLFQQPIFSASSLGELTYEQGPNLLLEVKVVWLCATVHYTTVDKELFLVITQQPPRQDRFGFRDICYVLTRHCHCFSLAWEFLI